MNSSASKDWLGMLRALGDGRSRVIDEVEPAPVDEQATSH
jgi:hypothetical protein